MKTTWIPPRGCGGGHGDQAAKEAYSSGTRDVHGNLDFPVTGAGKRGRPPADVVEHQRGRPYANVGNGAARPRPRMYQISVVNGALFARPLLRIREWWEGAPNEGILNCSHKSRPHAHQQWTETKQLSRRGWRMNAIGFRARSSRKTKKARGNPAREAEVTELGARKPFKVFKPHASG